MEQQIRFCASADGTRIAYADLGEGPPLVAVFSWATNLEMDWERPESRAWLERVAGQRRFVRFDRRGEASSQREVEDLSLAAHVSDLAAVVDHLELGQFALWGFGDGSAVSIAYAAQNPERVSRLILWQPYAFGEDAASPGTVQGLITLARENWSMARRGIANSVFPTGPVEMQRWMSTVLRESISPEMLVRYLQFQFGLDIRSYLSLVRAPTLVLQRRGDRIIPTSAGREVAAIIPDARFVALEGDIGYVFYGETAHIDMVEQFLDEGRQAQPTEVAGPFRTVLFTDLVGHTEMMSRLGDERGRAVLREHERITREVLKQFGGTEVKTMGDGFMASFGSVTKAVECAVALQRAFDERNTSRSARPEALVGQAADGRSEPPEPLNVRVGLNAGEPIEEDGDLFGSTVILASRIAAKADAGEILVADTVRGLCSGKGFLFADRGEFVAKGFEDPVRIYEVSWRTGG